GRVIFRRGQSQAGVLLQRKDGLDQALAERVLTQNPSAVVILDSAGDDLSGRGGEAVDQHDDGVVMTAVALAGGVGLLGRGASAMGDYYLPLAQEAVGDGDALIQQAAGVVAQIENQALDIVLTQHLQVLFDLRAGGLVELLDLHVGDALVAFEPDGILDALARNLVANHIESQRFFAAFPRNDYLDLRAARSFEQIGYLGG